MTQCLLRGLKLPDGGIVEATLSIRGLDTVNLHVESHQCNADAVIHDNLDRRHEDFPGGIYPFLA
jgi:hypothetical protein